MDEARSIAIVGGGRIGSTFALHLVRAGHDVTVVARGARLEALQREGAVVAVDGVRAAVRAVGALDPAVRYDLVIVAVLAQQVDALLPALVACRAPTVLFMFNTFERLARWRDAIGHARFAAGFPNMTAFLVDGKLRSVVNGLGMNTTLSHAGWAAVFEHAGMPTEVEHDMESFLRSHVAFVVPLMVAAMLTWKRGSDLSWAEATRLAAAWREGIGLVRALGHALTPRFVALIGWLPVWILTPILWAFSRAAAVKNLGEFGPGEVRALIDAMAAAAPGRTPMLVAIRP